VTQGSEATVAALLADRLDDSNAEALGEALYRLAGRPRLVVDLAAVGSVCSLGLAKLVCLHRRVSESGGQLALANVQPFVQAIFEVTGLSRLFGLRSEPPVPASV
jgi:anti-sigma B factor antagonist